MLFSLLSHVHFHLDILQLILAHPKVVIGIFAAVIASSIVVFQVAALEFWINARVMLISALAVFGLLFMSQHNEIVALKAQTAVVAQQVQAHTDGQVAVAVKVKSAAKVAKHVAARDLIITNAPAGTAVDRVMDDMANEDAQAH